jgi:hypothetical protein
MDRTIDQTQSPKTFTKTELQVREDSLPTFIYTRSYDFEQLWRTNLVTGLESCYRTPSYEFKLGCVLSELPGGCLLVTGGGYPEVSREVVAIGTLREFAVTHQSPMLLPRSDHTCVYHTQHVYVLGGLSDSCLSECERYVCAENRWEALPPLPRACRFTSGVVVESSLYALGGLGRIGSLDLVQKLSLERLVWALLELRLPRPGYSMACFKLSDTEVYLVVDGLLMSFTPHQVLPLKPVSPDIDSWYGQSYYSRGTLYCSTQVGVAPSWQIGSLSSSPNSS